jgi:transposase
MSLARDDQATGFIRLWAIGLQVLTRLELAVRSGLARTRSPLRGLYVGHPKRATARPTAERLLEAFQGLTLTIIQEGRRRRRHLTQLSRVQQRLLALLDFPLDIDMRLCPNSHKPP